MVKSVDALIARQRECPEAYQPYDDTVGPQPARHPTWNDQRAHVGRRRQGGTSKLTRLVAIGHNLARGIAAAALRNLKFCDYMLYHARPLTCIFQLIFSRLAKRSTSLTYKCLPRSPRYASQKNLQLQNTS